MGVLDVANGSQVAVVGIGTMAGTMAAVGRVVEPCGFGKEEPDERTCFGGKSVLSPFFWCFL